MNHAELARCREKWRWYRDHLDMPATLRKALGPTEGRRRLIALVREDFWRALSAREPRYASTRDSLVWRRLTPVPEPTAAEVETFQAARGIASRRIADALLRIERVGRT